MPNVYLIINARLVEITIGGKKSNRKIPKIDKQQKPDRGHIRALNPIWDMTF